jgi:hypothetical protein
MVAAKMNFSPDSHKINTSPSDEKQYLSGLNLGLTSTTDETALGFREASLKDLVIASMPESKSLLNLLLRRFVVATMSLVVLRLPAENSLKGSAGNLD